MERIHVHYYPERRVNEEDRVHASSTFPESFLDLNFALPLYQTFLVLFSLPTTRIFPK